MDKDKVIYELWKLLDDIDTMSDMAKSDNTLYRAQVDRIQAERWKSLNNDQVDVLYAKYHPVDEAEAFGNDCVTGNCEI